MSCPSSAQEGEGRGKDMGVRGRYCLLMLMGGCLVNVNVDNNDLW